MTLNETVALFEFPKQAAFGRVVPKSKIYEHASPSKAVRELFVRQVEQIVWQYKLSPDTTNLPARPGVQEIQVFSIALKVAEMDFDVLRCIDQAIPSPILFQLNHGGRTQIVAAYKRPSEADSAKWVVSDYFATSWVPAETPRNPLPMALDMASLYEQLLHALMPLPPRAGETLSTQVERLGQIRTKQREADKMTVRLQKEKQFNRKVEINAQLRDLKNELKQLGH